MENPQHPADDGESQGNEKINRTHYKGVNQDDLYRIPHGSVTPLSELSKNQQNDPSLFLKPKKIFFTTNEKLSEVALEKKRIQVHTKHCKKKSRKNLKIPRKSSAEDPAGGEIAKMSLHIFAIRPKVFPGQILPAEQLVRI